MDGNLRQAAKQRSTTLTCISESVSSFLVDANLARWSSQRRSQDE
jgi:hypothetical protein